MIRGSICGEVVEDELKLVDGAGAGKDAGVAIEKVAAKTIEDLVEIVLG